MAEEFVPKKSTLDRLIDELDGLELPSLAEARESMRVCYRQPAMLYLIGTMFNMTRQKDSIIKVDFSTPAGIAAGASQQGELRGVFLVLEAFADLTYEETDDVAG